MEQPCSLILDARDEPSVSRDRFTGCGCACVERRATPTVSQRSQAAAPLPRLAQLTCRTCAEPAFRTPAPFGLPPPRPYAQLPVIHPTVCTLPACGPLSHSSLPLQTSPESLDPSSVIHHHHHHHHLHSTRQSLLIHTHIFPALSAFLGFVFPFHLICSPRLDSLLNGSPRLFTLLYSSALW